MDIPLTHPSVTSSELADMRRTLADKLADAKAFELKLQQAEQERISVLHLEVGLATREELIRKLRGLEEPPRGRRTGLSAELKAKLKADLEAGLPEAEIRAKYQLSKRALGGFKGALKAHA